MVRAVCSSLVFFLMLALLAKSVFNAPAAKTPTETPAQVSRVPSKRASRVERQTTSSPMHRIDLKTPSRSAGSPRTGIKATLVSDRIELIDPAAVERPESRVPRRKIPREQEPEFDISVDFGPAQEGDPVYRLSRSARVKKRPIDPTKSGNITDPLSVDESDEPPSRSVRDTFDRLAPEALRTRPHARKEDGTVVPITETADWSIPLTNPSAGMEARRRRIRQCLDFYYDRPLNTAEDSSWSMMHHMVAWGKDSRIYVGPPGGRVVSTIGWMCANGICDHNRLLFVRDGQIGAKLGPGLQGHRGQFLAMLAQSRVHIDQPIRVGSEEFTVRDLLEQEMRACVPRSELTFMLIGGSHYLHTDTKWTSRRGQEWSIPRLIFEEMRQPINGVTCGGTHRLMGVSYAIRRREADGFSITGNWEKARQYTRRYQNKAFAMQNRDGSFSSDFWRSKGSWGDINRKLKTTGHTLEWLVFSLPHEELQSPRLLAALDYLTNLLVRNRYYDWENGPLGHGIRALNLYEERMFGVQPGGRRIEVVSSPVPRRTQTTQRSDSSRNEQPVRPQFIRGRFRGRSG